MTLENYVERINATGDEALLRELDAILGHLGEYRAAIAQNDASTLRRLLEEGRQRKEAVDGKGTNTPDPN